jgi:hypothetical protein
MALCSVDTDALISVPLSGHPGHRSVNEHALIAVPSCGHPGHHRLCVEWSQGKLRVHLNLPVLHRLLHGRVLHQEGAADREATGADASCEY